MYLNTFIPGQYSVPNYNIPGAGDTVDYYPGQYARLEPGQHNFDLVANHVHMPYPYSSTSTSHAGTFWREAETYPWLTGAVLELSWGKIEISEGVYDLDFYDAVFNTFRGFATPKRVMFLLNMRHLKVGPIEDFIPAYLQTMPAGVNVSNGESHYKNTTTYPLNPTSGAIQNAIKYDHVWACAGRYDSALTTQTFKGYNFNMHKFAASAGTNTLKTRFYAFLEVLADRYADEPLFGGFVGTESATGEILSTINGSVTTTYEDGNSIRKTYEGRFEIVKKIKSLFPNKIMAECVNFDPQYYDELTGTGATNGLIKNRLAFSTANLHIGKNLLLGNINAVMKGNVPVVMQVQPLDQRTATGNQPSWYDWKPEPPNYGNPTTPITGYTTTNTSTAWDDPPTPAWMWERIKYFNANMVIYQRNIGTAGMPTGVTWCQWPVWVNFMNDPARKNLPYGGMIGTKPRVL
jgi:hypothetical protein